MLNKYQSEFQNWIEKEKKALELINVVGKLWFDRSIELVLFRKPLFDIGSSEILAHHQYAKEVTGKENFRLRNTRASNYYCKIQLGSFSNRYRSVGYRMA
jgi:hypothetical protein